MSFSLESFSSLSSKEPDTQEPETKEAPKVEARARMRACKVESLTHPQFTKEARYRPATEYPDRPAKTPPSVRFESSSSPTNPAPNPTAIDKARNFFKSLGKK